MSLYSPSCDTVVQDPSCSNCPEKELGDIRQFGFLHIQATITDPSDASEWTTEATAGNFVKFPYGRGTLSQTPTESNGFGNVETQLDGFEYVADVEEPQYADNWAFWNSIKNSRQWRFVYCTETQVHISDEAATIIPTAPIGDDKKGLVNWKINVKFTQEDLVRPYDKPTGTFDAC